MKKHTAMHNIVSCQKSKMRRSEYKYRKAELWILGVASYPHKAHLLLLDYSVPNESKSIKTSDFLQKNTHNFREDYFFPVKSVLVNDRNQFLIRQQFQLLFVSFE